ncbi:MAG: hypothetical protein ACREBF_02820 [Candidatus Micrarchaeales archaeon]
MAATKSKVRLLEPQWVLKLYHKIDEASDTKLPRLLDIYREMVLENKNKGLEMVSCPEETKIFIAHVLTANRLDSEATYSDKTEKNDEDSIKKIVTIMYYRKKYGPDRIARFLSMSDNLVGKMIKAMDLEKATKKYELLAAKRKEEAALALQNGNSAQLN